MRSSNMNRGLPATQDPGLRTQDSARSTQHSALSTLHFPGWSPAFQAALERLAVAARRPARSQYAGAVRSRARGRALEFADYRPYIPGDDPKLVDWSAYARLGRLYLKQYEEERSRSLTLLVDVSASMDWGEGEAHKGLYARRLTAALAWIGLSRQERVVVHLLRDGVAAALPPTAARSSASTLFHHLDAVQEGGRTDLVAALHGALRGSAAGPTVLLTDLLDPAWPEALKTLTATQEGILLHLLSPGEWDPPLGEEVELEDAETGELRPTRLGPVELAARRRQLEGYLSRVGDTCRRLALAYVVLNTGVPMQEVVLRHLTAAGILVG